MPDNIDQKHKSGQAPTLKVTVVVEDGGDKDLQDKDPQRGAAERPPIGPDLRGRVQEPSQSHGGLQMDDGKDDKEKPGIQAPLAPDGP